PCSLQAGKEIHHLALELETGGQTGCGPAEHGLWTGGLRMGTGLDGWASDGLGLWTGRLRMGGLQMGSGFGWAGFGWAWVSDGWASDRLRAGQVGFRQAQGWTGGLQTGTGLDWWASNRLTHLQIYSLTLKLLLKHVFISYKFFF